MRADPRRWDPPRGRLLGSPGVLAATIVLAIAGLGTAGLQSGCASGHALTTPRALTACRAPLPPGAAPSPIRWILPAAIDDQRALDPWCEAVGAPIIAPATAAPAAPADELAILSWNVHVGAGDVGEVVARVRRGDFSGGRPLPHLVLLLQEVYRADPSLPRERSLRAFADAIQPKPRGRDREAIADVARRLGLSLYYAPSMRNGAPLLTQEDRGNAILSTLPLSEFSAVELPFERQRRVALVARIGGRTSSGRPWSLLLTSTHFDNLAGPHHAFILTGAARVRQARSLLSALPANEPTVLGGDLNTWFGYSDPAFHEFLRAFPQTPLDDRRATFFGVLRLDHLFFRLPPGWTAQARRLDDRFGSDHYPLLGVVRIG